MTYWENTGKNDFHLKELQQLIPYRGSVEGKHLEIFRQAQNCYRDLYNNNLCNREEEFKLVYEFSPKRYKEGHGFNAALYKRVEKLMDKFIMNAYKEQMGGADA